MLEITKAELDSYDAFSTELPPVVDLVLDSINNINIPTRMKKIVAISEIVSFAAQFKRNIWHWDGFELPINATSFIIAKSGAGKDSSVKGARRCFALGYDLIEKKRLKAAKDRAVQAASDAGEDVPYEFESYKKYYEPPAPVLIAPTTPQGLIQHLNDISTLPFGSGSIYAG